MPIVDKATMQSTLPRVFFGGDAAFGRRTSSGPSRTATMPPCRSTALAIATMSPRARFRAPR